jgi:hypothetical protein
MRKFMTSALAAVTFAGAVAATATPAAADHYRRTYYRSHRGSDAAAAAIVAGVAGLAIGSALSSNGGSRTYYRERYYDRPYYGRSYYGGSYYYDDDYYRPRICISRERVWDPYIGRRVVIQREYHC